MTPISSLLDKKPYSSLQEKLIGNSPNNLDFLRLFAAFLVLFGHSFTLILSRPDYIFPHDPVSAKILGITPFSEGLPGIGLHIFFFISGLLVTRSFFTHQGNLYKFISARALRIMPAYTVCILLTALALGPWLSTLSLEAYFSGNGPLTYIGRHLTFTALPYLPGVFVSNPFGPSVNGSLWTIPLELQMYAWVLFLGILTVLRNRALFIIFFAYCILSYCGSGRSFIFFGPIDIPRLWIFFFLGTLFYIYAEKIVFSPVFLFTSGSLIFFTWKPGNPWFDVIGAAWMCYLILFFGFYRYFPRINIGRIGDFSYGVYLYAFPVQQILIHFFRPSLNGWSIAFCTLLITLPIAALSWYGIEKPALSLKRRDPKNAHPVNAVAPNSASRP